MGGGAARRKQAGAGTAVLRPALGWRDSRYYGSIYYGSPDYGRLYDGILYDCLVSKRHPSQKARNISTTSRPNVIHMISLPKTGSKISDLILHADD